MSIWSDSSSNAFTSCKREAVQNVLSYEFYSGDCVLNRQALRRFEGAYRDEASVIRDPFPFTPVKHQMGFSDENLTTVFYEEKSLIKLLQDFKIFAARTCFAGNLESHGTSKVHIRVQL
eukprot:1186665-Prorocentrum_minimum.AAC.4